MNRRGFLGGLIAALSAPAIIRTPGLLMPVRKWLPYDPPDVRVIYAPDGSIASVTVLNPGSGYSHPPHVVITGSNDFRLVFNG